MILDAITSSPVIITIALGLGLILLYFRKPSNRSLTNHSATRSTEPEIIDEEIQRAIAQIERQERDMIRQEQDEAYQQSLKADREKQRKREEERRQKEAREVEERTTKENLERLRSEIADKIPPEPSQSQDYVKLVFKLPDGTRFTRRFQKKDKVKHLYWFVFAIENAPLQFKMTTNFPKRDLPGRSPLPEDFTDGPSTTEANCEQTLEEANVLESQILFVYDLEA